MRIGEKKQQILSTFKKGWVSIMDQGKLTRVLKSMEEHEIPQMIISDPVAIFYLTGKWIFPGERLLALYLNVNGNHKMMINKLFPQESDLGVDIIYYDDIEANMWKKIRLWESTRHGLLNSLFVCRNWAEEANS